MDEIHRRIERKFYASVWLSFMDRFNIGRDCAQFNDWNQCVGLKICKSIDTFKSLKVISRESDPESRVVLFGTTKLRITVWPDFLAVEGEDEATQ